MTPYQSPFTDWHRTAAVRSMAVDGWLAGPPGAWMPDEPDSVLAHAAVQGARRACVAAGLLLASLDFTVQLENQLIARVANDIAAQALQAQLPGAAVLDAMRVQCDEAYHALLAQELMARVQALTGAAAPRRAHRFLQHVQHIAAAAAAQGIDAALVRFCAAVVAETLITKSLRDDWQGNGLQQDVRAFLHHHYQDETRHSAYFARLLDLVWPQWPAPTQRALAPLWAGLIDAFLAADEEATLDALQDAGLPPHEAARIVRDCATPEGVLRRRRASTQQTLHALRRAGALDEQGLQRMPTEPGRPDLVPSPPLTTEAA